MTQPANAAYDEGDYLPHGRWPRGPVGPRGLREAERLEAVRGGEGAGGSRVAWGAPGGADLGALARELERNREALEAAQWCVLSGVAASLAVAASTMQSVLGGLQSAHRNNLVSEEDLAREMGYVDDEGNVERKQFVQDMRRCGVERHKTSRTRTFYLRDEVEAAIRRLGE